MERNLEGAAVASVQLGEYISSQGGVVSAEEMAPFLDPPAPNGEAQMVRHTGLKTVAKVWQKYGKMRQKSAMRQKCNRADTQTNGCIRGKKAAQNSRGWQKVRWLKFSLFTFH